MAEIRFIQKGYFKNGPICVLRAGGKRTYMQLYHTLYTKAEEYEYEYISLMDMQFSGIEINMQRLKLSLLYSQALYLLITEIYGEPLKKVIW